MDIYGTLQLCSIGILTAPACVRLSNTYFNSKGRNVLFLWTVLVLAGLLALTVEFFRSHSRPCLDDGSGRPLYSGSDFPYDETTCGLQCTVKKGPQSPMRDGSADNIYVVPAPYVLNFGAATLVAAASCIPGILSTVSIWKKIVKTNSVKRFGPPNADEVIEGTNGATVQGMKSVNGLIRRLLGFVEVPVFGGAVLALIVFGELNFWSGPLYFQTEPPQNIGQWSNICASAFAACGSLYMLLVKYLDRVEEEASMHDDLSHCHCTCHGNGSIRPHSISDSSETAEHSRPPPVMMTETDVRPDGHETAAADMLSPTRSEIYPDSEEAMRGLGIHTVDTNSSSAGNGSGVTKALMKLASLGTASSDRYDDTGFRQGKVTGFPEIPGELNRNSRLNQIKEQWGQPNTDIEDGLIPRGRRSRANSFNGSISRASSVGPRAHSPRPPPRSPTTDAGTSILGLPTTHSPESTSEPIFPSRPSAEGEKPRSQGTVVTLHEGPNSPAIVLSSDDEPGDAPEPTAMISDPVGQASEQTEKPTPTGGLSVPVEVRGDGSGGTAQRAMAEQQVSPPANGQPTAEVQSPPRSNNEQTTKQNK
ncbi:hypothetical protein B0I37DRAFT_384118 [Chaetomium sp. MPI-CAGE-AT-0009]|nr:hypothetical protein B0I37DRAFT_384118 [Chaetomium sp. MPI-CAGE-AT-0009]